MNELAMIMTQAQKFAEAWSLIGSPFGSDDQFEGADQLEQANAAKTELRGMIFALIAQRDEARARIEVLRQQKPVAYIMRCSNNIVEATIGVSVLPADYSAVKYFTGDMPLSQAVPLYAAPTPPSVPDDVANDAARYRYLASYFKCDPDMSGMHKWYGFRHSPILRGASLNDAVDAALAAAPKHGEQE